jgi:hypothetical protein
MNINEYMAGEAERGRKLHAVPAHTLRSACGVSARPFPGIQFQDASRYEWTDDLCGRCLIALGYRR